MTRGDYMKYARKRAGYTLDDLARASGVNKGTISGLETERTQGMISTIELLADALGLSIDEYIGHEVVARKPTATERYFGGR